MSGPHAEDEVFGMGTSAGTWDVMATLVNHTDRGDGYCGGHHDGVPPLDPCGVRLHYETVLSERNRHRR